MAEHSIPRNVKQPGRTTDLQNHYNQCKQATSVHRKPLPGSVVQDYESSSHQHAVVAAHLAFDIGQRNDQHKDTSRNIARTQSQRSPRRPRLSGEGSHLRRSNSLRAVGAGGSQVIKRPTTRKSTSLLSSYAAMKSSEPFKLGDAASALSSEQRFAERFDGYGMPRKEMLRSSGSVPGLTSKSSLDRLSVTPPSNARPRRLTVLAPTARENQTDETIIALARDQYLREHQTRTLKKRSSLLIPFRSLTRKSKREAMLTDETLSVDKASLETQQPQPNPLEHHPPNPIELSLNLDSRTPRSTSRQRRISTSLSSLKRSWRRTFGRSTSGQIDFPVQHIVSKTLHYRQRSLSRDNVQQIPSQTTFDIWPEMPEIPPPPPPHLTNVCHFPPTRSGEENSGNRQGEQANYSRSRVTSWNDSTGHNTISLSDPGQLSVIKESPESRSPTGLGISTILPDYCQSPAVSIRKSSSRFNIRSGLDGRRIVSALMRHKREVSHEEHSVPTPSFSISAAESEGHQALNSVVKALASYNGSYSTKDLSTKYGEIPNAREDVISPSVYSEKHRAEEISPRSSSPHVPSTPPGMATVTTSEAVTRWSLDGKRRTHKQSTSDEWRLWAADEFSGLDGRASFSIPEFSAPISRHAIDSGFQGNFILNRQTNLANAAPRQPSPTLAILHRQQLRKDSAQIHENSLMFDRNLIGKEFEEQPYGNNGASMQATRSSSDRSQLHGGIENIEKPGNTMAVSGRERSNLDLLSRFQNDLPPTSVSQEDTAGLRSQEPSLHSVSADPSPNQVQLDDFRQPGRGRGLDENFLLRIRKGPYGGSPKPVAKVPTSSIDSLSLPKRLSTGSPALNNENTPPSRGQKMANDFLSSRSKAKSRNLRGQSSAFL